MKNLLLFLKKDKTFFRNLSVDFFYFFIIFKRFFSLKKFSVYTQLAVCFVEKKFAEFKEGHTVKNTLISGFGSISDGACNDALGPRHDTKYVKSRQVQCENH